MKTTWNYERASEATQISRFSKDHPLSEFVHFIQSTDKNQSSPDDLNEYGKLLAQAAYPTDLRFPNTMKIAIEETTTSINK